MDPSCSPQDLQQSFHAAKRPLVIDVRRESAFMQSGEVIAGALRRDPDTIHQWAPALPRAEEVVVYCVHGHEVSQAAAGALAQRGIRSRFLAGGLAGWKTAGGGLARKPVGASTRWVTRERPKIDRVACPWLIARFIDAQAEFLYVPAARVRAVAAEREAVAYDVPDVDFSHVGERCSFDAFVAAYGLQADPALGRLATIVRGADTGRLDLAPQSAGLLAISLGLSRLFADDHAMLRQAMTLYDALYLWCREGQDESHTRNPDAIR